MKKLNRLWINNTNNNLYLQNHKLNLTLTPHIYQTYLILQRMEFLKETVNIYTFTWNDFWKTKTKICWSYVGVLWHLPLIHTSLKSYVEVLWS